MNETITKGYKVTDSNMKCRGFQFEIDKEFTQPGKLELCGNGFHFCQQANDCFNYYDFNSSNRVFEIEAYGDIKAENDKSCASKIKILKELSWQEVLVVVNIGKDNTGRGNSGDSNSGNWNSGDSNSGRNSGDSNSGYRNSGAFCTEKDPTLYLFNKPTKMTVREWENHPACEMMYKIDPTIWVPWSIMTDEEKKINPKYEASEGYTKSIPITEAWVNFWGNLTDSKKKIFTDLPNFDAKIFEEITGIKL